MYLCVDVGGTKTLLAAFTSKGELVKEVRFETPKIYQDFLEKFKSNLTELDTTDFKAGAVAIPGRVDRQAGIGLNFGNLPWKNVPIQADIERLINAPVKVENDAKAGALFEAVNVKNDFKRVLYIAIGTGIGIGVVTNGVIDTEIGDLGGSSVPVAYSNKKKYWEQIASGKAIVKKYGKRAEDITDAKSWKAIAHDLAVGFADLIAIIEPDIVLVGGGIGTYFDRYADYLWKELKKYETPMMPIPPIKQAVKPEEAVIYGCYELVKQNYGQSTN